MCPFFPPLTSSSLPYSLPQAFTNLFKLFNLICYKSNYAMGKTAEEDYRYFPP